jgi:hypothetical protein
MQTFGSTILGVLVVLGICCAALLRPPPLDRLARRVESAARRIARRKALCCVMVGLATLAFRAALFPVYGFPRPDVADEFSYILGADTFASGHLTNPPHPLWQFFESAHILVKPTYMTKYPPGQSLAMAAGQALFGHPWFGVWLSCGIMVGAICWMLQGWLPPGWALFGAVCAMIRPGVTGYFMNSYWGGAVAAIGGCLMLGAYPRITRRNRLGYAWIMGLGLMILANSRPWEGAMAALPVAIALFFHFARRSPLQMARVAAPLVACLTVLFILMAYYNTRVTGNPLRMPYSEHIRQYQFSPPFIFMKDYPLKTYRDNDLYWYYAVFDKNLRHKAQVAFISTRASELWFADHTFLEVVMLAPLLLAPLVVLRDRRIRLLLICLLTTLAAASIAWGMSAHYLAPATGCIFALAVQCLRHLRCARFPGRAASRVLIMLLPLGAFAEFGITRVMGLDFKPLASSQTAPATTQQVLPAGVSPELLSTAENKWALEQKLLESGKKQLIFVRYHLSKDDLEEWIYNRADIDASPVVWAHDMGPQENLKLLAYYPDRQAWLFEPNLSPPRLSAYPR